MALWGHNTKFVTVPTREACIQSCREESSFACLSIDYRSWDNRCTLSNNNKYTEPTVYKIADDGRANQPAGQDTFSYCTVVHGKNKP